MQSHTERSNGKVSLEQSTNGASKTRKQFTQLPVPSPSCKDHVYSMMQFPDKSLFTIRCVYAAISVPVRKTATFRNQFKHLLLRKAKTRNVYADPSSGDRRLLVLKDLPEDLAKGDAAAKEYFGKDPVLEEFLKAGDDVLWHKNEKGECFYTIEQSYEDQTADEIFAQLLGGNITAPSAFEMVGKLAHLNLRDEQLPYKYWIGAVLLEKNTPAIRTVVNKIGTIETEFRTFPMEVIAGYGFENNPEEKDWSVVTVKEEGFAFTLDFRTVYWNSRLSGEHKRIVNLIREGAMNRIKDGGVEGHVATVVADLMAGVGPFAVPLTGTILNSKQKPKKQEKTQQRLDSTPRIRVYANDLNPESFKYLKINAKNNKCDSDLLKCFNLDAREFAHKLQDEILEEKNKESFAEIDHVIMNLPASAPEFLDCFRGWKLEKLPRVHVHCFAPKPQYQSGLNESAQATEDQNQKNQQHEYQVAVDRCSKSLGCNIDWQNHDVEIYVVRDVSPTKNMLCVSFNLPKEVFQLPVISIESTECEGDLDKDRVETLEKNSDQLEPQNKRIKLKE